MKIGNSFLMMCLFCITDVLPSAAQARKAEQRQQKIFLEAILRVFQMEPSLRLWNLAYEYEDKTIGVIVGRDFEGLMEGHDFKTLFQIDVTNMNYNDICTFCCKVNKLLCFLEQKKSDLLVSYVKEDQDELNAILGLSPDTPLTIENLKSKLVEIEILY